MPCVAIWPAAPSSLQPAAPPRPAAQRRRRRAPKRADWVARQIDERDTGRDSRLEMTMRLFDRQGRVRERVAHRHLAPSARHARRSRARPLHSPPTTSRAPASSSGSIPPPKTSAFSICRRSAASAASPVGEAGELRRQRPVATKTSAAASSTTTPTRSSSATRRGRPRRRTPSGWQLESKPVDQRRRVSTHGVARPQGQLRRRRRRHLQPAQRAREALRRPAARADRRHLDGDGRRHGQRAAATRTELSSRARATTSA